MTERPGVLTTESSPERGATERGQRAGELGVVALASLGHALCHIAELMFSGVLLAVQAEFALSPRLATALPLLGWVLMGVGAVPAGLLTDRYSPRSVLLAYFLSVAIAALFCAAAVGTWSLVVGLTLLGAAVSLYHPAGLTLLSFGCRRKGQAMGIHGVAGSVGITVGPAIGLALAKVASWRWAYGLVAVLAVLGFAFMLVTGAGSGIAGRRAAGTAADRSVPEQSPDRRFLVWVLLSLYPAFLLGGLCYRAFTTALPALLERLLSGRTAPSLIQQWGPVVLTMIPLALGSVGQFYGGRWADRVAPHRLYLRLIAFAAPAALAVALAPNVWLVVLAASILGLVQFAEQPVENTIIAHVTPAERRSTFYSLKFILGFGVGAFGSTLVGEIWERTGHFQGVFGVVALLTIGMFFFARAFSREVSHRQRVGGTWHSHDVAPG